VAVPLVQHAKSFDFPASDALDEHLVGLQVECLGQLPHGRKFVYRVLGGK
jgi:hypothetical protein